MRKPTLGVRGVRKGLPEESAERESDSSSVTQLGLGRSTTKELHIKSQRCGRLGDRILESRLPGAAGHGGKELTVGTMKAKIPAAPRTRYRARMGRKTC